MNETKNEVLNLTDALNMEDSAFAASVRERYQAQGGLSAVFAAGKTRTTYILDKGRGQDDPGKIKDFVDHGEYLGYAYRDLIKNYFDLGGQYLLVTAFSFLGLHNRGEDYAKLASIEMLRLISDKFEKFYVENNIDTYFVGVDSFLRTPEDTIFHQMAQQLADYRKTRPATPGNKVLLWEVASIPLLSFWQAYRSLSEEQAADLDRQLAELGDDLVAVHGLLYRFFSRIAYGVEVPMTNFYLGCSYSGDFKWRSPMPISLSGGEGLRLLYTPYPTLFINRQMMKSILADVAFKERWHSGKVDYAGRYSRELVQAEYDRVMTLSHDYMTTQGLVRKVGD